LQLALFQTDSQLAERRIRTEPTSEECGGI
jgi:hypothetical protein